MTTFETLTLPGFEPTESDPSTSSAADSPASPSATQASEPAPMTRATSGRQCAELLARSDPLGSLLRTLLVTSPWGSTRCSLTWKPTATPGGRLLFRLQPSTHRTSVNGSGSWLATATATATANQLCPSMQKWKGCAAIWPTPTTDSATTGSSRYAQGGMPLSMAAAMWPTPTSSDHKSGAMSDELRAAREAHPRGEKLANLVGGSLNPEWVEWLMGYPPGYTEV